MSKEILGREELVEYMKSTTKNSTLSHAYIFEGEKGMGKLFLAKEFARLILSMDKNEEECRLISKKIDNDNNPDIIYVEPDKMTVISVEEIRSKVVSTLNIFPYGTYKIYIINEAEKMNEQAQNALLKSIEEPPNYVIIILLSANKNKLLPTILSRCILLNINPINPDKIKNYLIKEYEVVDYVADMAAKFSDGNIGRAVRYALSDDFIEMKNNIVNILRNLDSESTTFEIKSVLQLETYKNEIKDCIELMILWFKDLLLLKATDDVNKILFKEEYKILREQVSRRNYSAIEKGLEAMEKAKIRITSNVRLDIAIKLMLMHMRDFV